MKSIENLNSALHELTMQSIQHYRNATKLDGIEFGKECGKSLGISSSVDKIIPLVSKIEDEIKAIFSPDEEDDELSDAEKRLDDLEYAADCRRDELKDEDPAREAFDHDINVYRSWGR